MVATGPRPKLTRCRRPQSRAAIAFHGLAACCLLLVFAVGTSHAEGRVALVIGNDSYQNAPKLSNARNDAKALAAALQKLGFTLIGGGAQLDGNRQQMLGLIHQFADQLSADDVALFYFAGHGVAGDNQNWLLPINDGDIKVQEDVPDYAVSALTVLNRLQERGGGINVIILDACRNNPLPNRRRSAMGSRGLTRMQAPFGSFVVYAAGLGEAALDSGGGNGVFTRELLARIATPGLRIDDLFTQVRNAVRAASHGEQTPWSESSLPGVFYLVPGPAPAAALVSDFGTMPLPAKSGDPRTAGRALRQSTQGPGTAADTPSTPRQNSARSPIWIVEVGPGSSGGVPVEITAPSLDDITRNRLLYFLGAVQQNSNAMPAQYQLSISDSKVSFGSTPNCNAAKIAVLTYELTGPSPSGTAVERTSRGSGCLLGSAEEEQVIVRALKDAAGALKVQVRQSLSENERR